MKYYGDYNLCLPHYQVDDRKSKEMLFKIGKMSGSFLAPFKAQVFGKLEKYGSCVLKCIRFVKREEDL